MSRAGASLVDAVRRSATGQGLLPAGCRVVVGVSGGADSVALLHVLWMLRTELSVDLVAAHLDHALRADSDRDAAAVDSLCRDLGVPLCRERLSGAPAGASPEAAARAARYAFLARTAAARRASRVAVAHHGDDQAETVLLRLLRGSGAEGLRGMAASRPLGPAAPGVLLVRPLLASAHADAVAHCRAAGLPFREDPTNLSPAFLRNRVRHGLLPLLEREYNPAVRRALARTAELLAADDDALHILAATQLDARVGPAGLMVGGLATQPAAVAQRVLRAWWRRASGSAAPLGFSHVAGLLSLRPGGALDLPLGLRAVRRADLLVLERGAPPLQRAYLRPLPVPGAVDVPEAGMRVSARLVPWPGPRAADPGALPPHVAVGDADVLALPLAVRSRRPGDRMRPLGGVGSREGMRLREGTRRAVLLDAVPLAGGESP
jgi:tRNA(Ile)-lysidine synthase